MTYNNRLFFGLWVGLTGSWLIWARLSRSYWVLLSTFLILLLGPVSHPRNFLLMVIAKVQASTSNIVFAFAAFSGWWLQRDVANPIPMETGIWITLWEWRRRREYYWVTILSAVITYYILALTLTCWIRYSHLPQEHLQRWSWTWRTVMLIANERCREGVKTPVQIKQKFWDFLKTNFTAWRMLNLDF